MRGFHHFFSIVRKSLIAKKDFRRFFSRRGKVMLPGSKKGERFVTTILLCQLSRAKNYTTDVLLTMTVKPIKAVENIDVLMPTKALVYDHKGYTGYQAVSDEQYTETYVALLNSRLKAITAWYTTLERYEHITLCCYCRKGNFCHRRIVYQLFLWLNARTGLAYDVILE